MLRSDAARRTLEFFRDRKKINFLYGSDATRRVWASEGFDGKVLYWSGIPRNSISAKGQLNTKPPTKTTILSVGTSGPRKGTRTLIEAFAQACRRGLIPDETQLVIVGVIPPSINIHSRDVALRTLRPDLKGRVRLVATVDPATLASYYEDAHLYVQTSNMECLPLALLTAMAHGIPIITTDVDGCKEAIINGECGLTVPSRHSNRLADAIGEILSDPAKSRQFGHAARLRFESVFSLETNLKHMFAVFGFESLNETTTTIIPTQKRRWPKSAIPS
jgi:glycosyltransferase involved in cell wall biosynthesis